MAAQVQNSGPMLVSWPPHDAL